LIKDAVIAKKRKKGTATDANPQPMGMRWPVERTNSWLSNFGQLRRNTDLNFPPSTGHLSSHS
jgi:hypothetical protein